MAIGHTSQNSTKLNDELCAAGAPDDEAFEHNFYPEDDQWDGEQISFMPPITRRGHNGRPRGSTSPVHTRQLPPKSPFTTATTATPSPTSVTEAPSVSEERIVGGFESPAPARMPDAARAQQIQSRAAEDRADGRADRTKSLYGDLKDPEVGTGSGYIGEFRKWCAIDGEKGESLNGVKAHPDKHKYLPRPTSVIVLEYLKDHFLQRKKWNSKDKEYNKEGHHSKGAIENCVKALKAYWDYQAGMYAGGPEAYSAEVGQKPNTINDITALKRQQFSQIAQNRRDKHQPRGAGALLMEGYTRDQNRQLFEFGLTNETLRDSNLKMERNKMRTTHTHHVFAHNGAMRFDDRMKLLLSQFCCMKAPGVFVDDKEAMLLTLVLDWRKTNQTGQFETLNFLRHLSDPRRCSWFSFALELFCQIHLQGMSLKAADFKPYYDDDGELRHRWYDRYFFYGNTQSRKGQASQPNPYNQCVYNNTSSAFTTVYAYVEPPILSYHKLHLQRGSVAREADGDGVEVHEIAGAGGWKRDGALFNNYLTGVPMTFVQWVCGYDQKLDPDNLPVIKRALVDPPEKLVHCVFPFVKEVRKAKERNPKEWEGTDQTLWGFLDCCELAAKYFVQDCAHLYPTMSEHPVFTTPLFCCPAFMEYMAEANKAEAEFVPKPNPKHAYLQYTESIMKGLRAIYRKLGGGNGFGECDPMEERQVVQDDDASVFNVSDSEDESGGEYFGAPAPSGIGNPSSPMRRAQMPEPEVGCDLLDSTTWPEKTPIWAFNAQINLGVSSPTELVQEYLKGYPSPPALRDLEAVYGAAAVKGKKGVKAWRSGNGNTKEGNKKKKNWCVRKPLYDVIEKILENGGDVDECIVAIEEMVDDKVGSELVGDQTPTHPGSTGMQLLFKTMKEEKEGAKKRSQEAKARAQKRRKNKGTIRRTVGRSVHRCSGPSLCRFFNSRIHSFHDCQKGLMSHQSESPVVARQ